MKITDRIESCYTLFEFELSGLEISFKILKMLGVILAARGTNAYFPVSQLTISSHL